MSHAPRHIAVAGKEAVNLKAGLPSATAMAAAQLID